MNLCWRGTIFCYFTRNFVVNGIKSLQLAKGPLQMPAVELLLAGFTVIAFRARLAIASELVRTGNITGWYCT